jgi:hypothetical protein
LTVFRSAGRKKLEALIDDLACSYLRGDPSNSEQGRDEICWQIAEVADGLVSAGDAKSIARAHTYRPDMESGCRGRPVGICGTCSPARSTGLGHEILPWPIRAGRMARSAWSVRHVCPIATR